MLIHAAGAGALSYRPLARCLPPNWHICCVNDLALADASSWVHQSITSVGAEYTEIIREHLLAHGRAQAPIVLAGWSYGGVVAIEVAKRLQSANQPIVRLVLFDAPVTLGRAALSEEQMRSVLDKDVAQVLYACAWCLLCCNRVR